MLIKNVNDDYFNYKLIIINYELIDSIITVTMN